MLADRVERGPSVAGCGDDLDFAGLFHRLHHAGGYIG